MKKILIINWTNGENDPFTFFSHALSGELERYGRQSIVLNTDLNRDKFPAELLALDMSVIDFVILFQGLGSSIARSGSKITIWEELGVPLVCFHGDHPSHAPFNHQAISRLIVHTYVAPSFANYANQWFPRKKPATLLTTPIFYPKEVNEPYQGDFFYLPKNLDDISEIFIDWKNRYAPVTSGFLISTAQEIKLAFENGNSENHHLIIDRYLTQDILDTIRAELMGKENKIFYRSLLSPRPLGHSQLELNHEEIGLYHSLHSMIDKIHRNVIAEHVVESLPDVKMKIYGRGWERFQARNNKNHEFLSFDKTSGGAFQYSSNYGIIDVAPIYDFLHDRTFRAIANQNSFLIGSGWHLQNLLPHTHSDLFFDGSPHGLREKVEKVLQSPQSHRERCRQFGTEYRATFPFEGFLQQIEKQVSEL